MDKIGFYYYIVNKRTMSGSAEEGEQKKKTRFCRDCNRFLKSQEEVDHGVCNGCYRECPVCHSEVVCCGGCDTEEDLENDFLERG